MSNIKQKLLNEYADKINQLNEVVNSGNDYINFIPDITDAWSIKTHISHLVQTQIESVNRTLLIIRNDMNLNYVSNSGEWITLTQDYEFDTRLLLDTINTISKLEIMVINNLSEGTFENTKISCSYKNEIGDISLIENIESTNWHLNFHIEYMKRNINEFKKKFLTTSST